MPAVNLTPENRLLFQMRQQRLVGAKNDRLANTGFQPDT
jgi:hypothetical protein